MNIIWMISIHRHTGKNLYYCHMCGKVFVKAIQLQRHSLTHDNDNKSFECYLCSSKFDRIHGLRIHFTILHTTKTKRNLPCPKCSKAFSKQRDLDLHIKIVRISKALFEYAQLIISSNKLFTVFTL